LEEGLVVKSNENKNQSTWNAPASTVLLMEVSNCEAQITNPVEDQSPANDGLSGGGDFDSYSRAMAATTA
jgi:hypothetical protein